MVAQVLYINQITGKFTGMARFKAGLVMVILQITIEYLIAPSIVIGF